MLKKMCSQLLFNRAVDPDWDAVSTVESRMAFGERNILFVFENVDMETKENDESIVMLEQYDIDDCYHAAEELSVEDVRSLKMIERFGIRVSSDICPENTLYPVKLLSLSFEFEDGTVVDCSETDAVKDFVFESPDVTEFKDECYKAYQLEWMLRQGYSLNDLSEVFRELFFEEIEEEPVRFAVPSDDITVDDFVDRLEEAFLIDRGFDGSLYVCKADFLQAEFLDEGYMAHLFSIMAGDAEENMRKWREITGQEVAENRETELTVKQVAGVWKVVGYLTPLEYAEKHGVREDLVRKWIYLGKLAAVQLGHGWWIKEGETLPPNISLMKKSERETYMMENGSRLTPKWHKENGSGWNRRKNDHSKKK